MQILRFLQHWLTGRGPCLQVADCVPETHPIRQWGDTFPWAVWSAKLSLAYPHRRLFEALELPIDLVQIKGLWIKLATDPFQHLPMLGVLRILYSVQKARVTPDATAILGRTGAFARQAHRVALPRF